METNQITMLPINELHAHPQNPRKNVGDVHELAESIQAQGIRQNLLVVPLEIGYRVIIGHRRLAAAHLAGLMEVPCVITTLSEREQMELMIVENCQRQDLTAIEEADAYQGLLDLGGKVATISERTGRSQSYVRSRLKIAHIPPLARGLASDFSQLGLDELAAIAEFNGDPDVQNDLARYAGTDNFNYHVQSARNDRDDSAWAEQARMEISRLGLPSLPDSVVVKNAWDDPKGYIARHYFSRRNDGLSFAEGWKSFATENNTEGLLAKIVSNRVVCYKKAAKKLKDTENKEIAEKKKRDLETKTFANTAMTARRAWIHENIYQLTDAQMQPLINQLTLHLFMGYSKDTLQWIGGSDFHDDVIRAYNEISIHPLPVTEKDNAQSIWHLTTENNLTEWRKRQKNSPTTELLLLLLSENEAKIKQHSWTEDWLMQEINAYYTLLASIGYPISSEEQAALAGGYVIK